MGEANENNSKNKEMLNLSLELEKYPRDLLQKLPPAASSQQSQRDKSPMSEMEDIELSLGLSLGGRFGVDKHAKKNLFRSSSIAGSIPMAREFDRVIPPATANMFTATNTTTASGSQGVPYTGLVRTASLPTETEEEWRKRKEMQTLRRLAAKRRRNEKKNASGNCQKSDKVESNLDGEKQNNLPLGMKSCSVAARKAAGGGGGGGFLQGFGQQPSQGFVEPQGGNSSGMSELEGSSSGGGSQTFKDQSNQELAAGSHGKPNENSTQEIEDTARKLERRNSRGGMRNSGEDMPSVFTDSPSGQRVEGILYKYGKGEEVRIMCICHGGFHSPLGFVKHAGHQDVGNPLRHIVVNPSAAPFP